MTDDTISRRNVLTAAVAAGAGAVLPTTITQAAAAAKEGEAKPMADAKPAADAKTVQPELYELRTYHLRRGPSVKRLDDYVRDAMVPAARRAGTGPVGVFGVTVGPGLPTLHVLIPHPSLESFATLPAKLAADAEYTKAAEPFLSVPATDPPYDRLDVRLLRAFPHFPRVEVPKPEPRIFELRTYRSHGERAGAKKVEMFDTAGEIAIFRRVGLMPVFFASDLTGDGLPSLTYLLTYADGAARERAWATFRADPEWKKLSNTPGFTDAEIVTGIENQLLAPTAYSQI